MIIETVVKSTISRITGTNVFHIEFLILKFYSISIITMFSYQSLLLSGMLKNPRYVGGVI